MTTQADVAVTAARKALYDNIESQIHTFEAQVATLRAKAESAKAEAELKAIADLVTARRTLHKKVVLLKIAGEAKFQQAKAEVEAGLAEFDTLLQLITSRLNAR